MGTPPSLKPAAAVWPIAHGTVPTRATSAPWAPALVPDFFPLYPAARSALASALVDMFAAEYDQSEQSQSAVNRPNLSLADPMMRHTQQPDAAPVRVAGYARKSNQEKEQEKL
jgi:hypothetical protein